MVRLLRKLKAVSYLVALTAVAYVLASGLAWAAQDIPGVPAGFPSPEVVTALTAVLAWGLTQAAKAIGPKLPRAVIYVFPFIFSAVVTQVAAWLGHAQPGWEFLVATIVSGALAIAGNEAKTTLQEHGLTGKGA